MRTYLAIRLCSYPIGYMNGKATDPPTALALETAPNLEASTDFQQREEFCRMVGSKFIFLQCKKPCRQPLGMAAGQSLPVVATLKIGGPVR